MRAPLLAGLLVLAGVAPALAGGPAKAVRPIELPRSLSKIVLGNPPVVFGAACNLGELRAPAFAVDYLAPVNDHYFTLLDPSPCTDCAADGVRLQSATIALHFDPPCKQEIIVRIVGAQGSGSCLAPDTNNVICPATTFLLDPLELGSYFFNLTLPEQCCITGPAFLSVTFASAGPTCTGTTVPLLGSTVTPCADCRSYNFYTGSEEELCSSSNWPPSVGNPAMFVEGTCCTTVPTLPHSWGRVKTIYR